MAGYSGTPLIKKLGVKSGDRLLLISTPENYENLIELWPDDVVLFLLKNAKNIDFIHFFTREMAELEVTFPLIKQKLKKGGSLWVSWPKGSSKLIKDLNGNDVRRIGLKNGLVDVKVCAIDKDWSALKFMYRTKDK